MKVQVPDIDGNFKIHIPRPLSLQSGAFLIITFVCDSVLNTVKTFGM